jgi:hypothetical protein
MSITARLHIAGHSKESQGLQIIACRFEFNQDVDPRGMARSNIRGGIITFSIRGNEDPELIQWMLDRNSMKSGKISYTGFTDNGPKRKIEFEDAVLIHYDESFYDKTDISINLTISARVFRIGGLKHENFWTKDQL